MFIDGDVIREPHPAQGCDVVLPDWVHSLRLATFLKSNRTLHPWRGATPQRPFSITFHPYGVGAFFHTFYAATDESSSHLLSRGACCADRGELKNVSSFTPPNPIALSSIVALQC
jgi:polygalacturonase